MTLKISHLVTVGCSFTFCQNLTDPTTQGWPALLAKKLGVPVVNLGIPGAGNDAIYRRTAEYLHFNKNNNSRPFFIIAFSQALRREEYFINHKGHELNNPQTLACYGDESIEKAIYEHMDDNGIYFAEFRKLLNWLSIVNMFKSNNILYYTTDYMANDPKSIKLLKCNYKEIFDTIYRDDNKLEDFHMLTSGIKKLPCGHDGEEAQILLANYCYNNMIKKYKKIIPTKSEYVNLAEYVKRTSFSNDFKVYNNWYKNINV